MLSSQMELDLTSIIVVAIIAPVILTIYAKAYKHISRSERADELNDNQAISTMRTNIEGQNQNTTHANRMIGINNTNAIEEMATATKQASHD